MAWFTLIFMFLSNFFAEKSYEKHILKDDHI